MNIIGFGKENGFQWVLGGYLRNSEVGQFLKKRNCMDFIIANDLHWGSPHELTSEKTLDLFIKEQPSNLILCGDIVDLYNCHPKRIDKAKEVIIALKKIYQIGKRILHLKRRQLRWR